MKFYNILCKNEKGNLRKLTKTQTFLENLTKLGNFEKFNKSLVKFN